MMKRKVAVFVCLFVVLFSACLIFQSPEDRQAANERKALARAKIVKENMFHGTLKEAQCRLTSGVMMTKGGGDDVLAGALVGWTFLGKTGALVGAVAGAESGQQITQVPGKIESLVFKVVGDDGLDYTFEIVEKNNCLACRPLYGRVDDITKDMLVDMKIGAKIKIPSLTKLDRLATVDARLIYYEEEQIPGLQ